MFIIGIDPHRGSHTAAVLDGTEEVLDELRVVPIAGNANGCSSGRRRSRRGCGRSKARPGPGRCWPSSSSPPASSVVDVPPTLSARVRLLDSGRSDKTDSHDARSAAVVALRHRSLRPVRAEDHVAVLRLLAKRHHDLIAARTRAVCRLHTTLCHLAEGHFPKRMTAAPGRRDPGSHPTRDAVSIERKALARDLLAEIRRARPRPRRARSPGSRSPSPRPASRSPTCSASVPSSPPI